MSHQEQRILVTGAAGFIGSHLCEKLIDLGYRVVGIDNFSEPVSIKKMNISGLLKRPGFKLIKADILDYDCKELVKGADVVYHLAATPGVRSSWGIGFRDYVRNNIWATQKLLEAVKDASVHHFILASTSSVYGNINGPAMEGQPLQPLSPYGVTKLAAEHISAVYHREFEVPVTVLRFFTVYGPRQRPDMAFHRFIKRLLTGTVIEIYGDGNQKRDFTHVSDIVNGCLGVLNLREYGHTFNLGGDRRFSVNEVIGVIERLTGIQAKRKYLACQPGEPRETWADIDKAVEYLNYKPVATLERGLEEEIRYIRELYSL